MGRNNKRPDFFAREQQRLRDLDKNKTPDGIRFPYEWTPLAVSVTPRIHAYLQTEEARRLIHAIERPAKKLGEKIGAIMRAEAEEAAKPKLFKCSGPNCPGYPYPASKHAHPASCNE